MVYRILLSCCFNCHKLVELVSKKKRSLISLKRFVLTKKVSLNREIVVGYCKGHEIIILFLLIDEFNKKTIRLHRKELEWQKN